MLREQFVNSAQLHLWVFIEVKRSLECILEAGVVYNLFILFFLNQVYIVNISWFKSTRGKQCMLSNYNFTSHKCMDAVKCLCLQVLKLCGQNNVEFFHINTDTDLYFADWNSAAKFFNIINFFFFN